MRTPHEEKIIKDIEDLSDTQKVYITYFSDNEREKTEPRKSRAYITEHSCTGKTSVTLALKMDDTFENLESAISECWALLSKMDEIYQYERNHPDFSHALNFVIKNSYTG